MRGHRLQHEKTTIPWSVHNGLIATMLAAGVATELAKSSANRWLGASLVARPCCKPLHLVGRIQAIIDAMHIYPCLHNPSWGAGKGAGKSHSQVLLCCRQYVGTGELVQEEISGHGGDSWELLPREWPY